MAGTSGDVFSEVIIKRKITPGNIAVRVLCGLVTAILLLLFMMGLFIEFQGLFIFVVVIFVAMYFVIRFQKVEYEYAFYAGELNFDQLSGDFRRKRKLSLTFESLDVIAPEGSHDLDQFNYGDYKIYDFSSHDKSKERFVYIGSGKTDKRVKVIFEPTPKMIDIMYNYSPRKVKKEKA